MQSAREYANSLSPTALIRSVTTVGTSLTRKVLFPPLPAPPQKPFKVSNWDRSKKKGIVARTLKELIEKSRSVDALFITVSLVTLVLEEDGTVVDTEDFFQSLEENTSFLLLEGRQTWTRVSLWTKAKRIDMLEKKKGVANIILDVYKLNPKDFIGCLNIKATFYEKYSVAFDIQCLGAKKFLRSGIRGPAMSKVRRLIPCGDRRFPTVAVSIGFAVNQELEFGVIYHCTEEKMYTGRRGHGAFCNQERLQVTKETGIRNALILTEIGPKRDPATLKLFLGNIETFLKFHAHGVRVIGSATLALCHIAAGAADAYYQYGLHCWDLAAATVIIQEAGGYVIDTTGGPLDLMSCRVVAAGTMELAQSIARELQTIDYGRDDS
ncbi:Inositol monophosphatase 2 [Pelobates cultripes]|uniref:inositol-phosphate phosphatase n=1 Tax=Pelobates cultripes TaxID=61616 RepID=A0AAD1S1J1_PELCU|nr:Inositol monophosphatase 2 [Pelobates cultripes]